MPMIDVYASASNSTEWMDKGWTFLPAAITQLPQWVSHQ